MSKKQETPVAPVGDVARSAPVQQSIPGVLPDTAPLISFEAWAMRRGVPVLHWAGMKAYTQLTLATEDEWAAAFNTY